MGDFENSNSLNLRSVDCRFEIGAIVGAVVVFIDMIAHRRELATQIRGGYCHLSEVLLRDLCECA